MAIGGTKVKLLGEQLNMGFDVPPGGGGVREWTEDNCCKVGLVGHFGLQGRISGLPHFLVVERAGIKTEHIVSYHT